LADISEQSEKRGRRIIYLVFYKHRTDVLTQIIALTTFILSNTKEDMAKSEDAKQHSG